MPYMWNLKINHTNELTKQKETHRLSKLTYGYQGEGTVRKFGIFMCTLLYLKWIQDLPYSMWNYAQCYVAALIGEGFVGEWIHVYVWLSSPLLFT